MRKDFFKQLHKEMAKNDRIIFMTGDLGFNLVEPIRDSFPKRFYNMQTAEFAMTGAAIGMCYSDKIPLIYSITPFVIYRNFELLRTYVNHEKIPIKIVGAGRDMDYKTEGISHHAHDVKRFLDLLPNIQQFWPETEEELVGAIQEFLYNDKAAFLSLKK